MGDIYASGGTVAYPTSLDTASNQTDHAFPLALASDTWHASKANNLASALIAIETELGVLPKGSYASVVARLNDAVYKVGDQTIAGAKIFSSLLEVDAFIQSGKVGTQGKLTLYSNAASGTGAFGSIEASNTTPGAILFTAGSGSAATANRFIFAASIHPSADDTQDLGATNMRFANVNIGTGLLLSGGAVRHAGLGAFVSSDKYVVIDASGNLHVSALGPAS